MCSSVEYFAFVNLVVHLICMSDKRVASASATCTNVFNEFIVLLVF